MDGQFWTLVTILGPILLAAALIWAYLKNRGDKRSLPETEAATRDLYRTQDALDKASDDKVQR